MADSIMLTMLKTDLGIMTTTAYDTRLTQLLTASQQYIINEGASTLDASNIEDMQLIVMYAAWLWRKRDGSMGPVQSYDATTMPRMLRIQINNRVFREKAGGDDA